MCDFVCGAVSSRLNPLPHYSIFRTLNNSNFQIFSKDYFLHINSFENVVENGTFAPHEQMFHFS